jgi:hypothetical protein
MDGKSASLSLECHSRLLAMRIDNSLSIYEVDGYPASLCFVSLSSFFFPLSSFFFPISYFLFSISSFFSFSFSVSVSVSVSFSFPFLLSSFLLGELKEDQKEDKYVNCQKQISSFQLTLNVNGEQVEVNRDL